MYLTIGVYLCCVALLIWGISFAGFNNYHDDFMSLDKTKNIRGLAALVILFHHISQESAFQNVGEMKIFVNAGPLLVAIFFFCSGYGLIKGLNSKPDYLKGFLKKRVGYGLAITFYVNVLLYAAYHLIVGTEWAIPRWITNYVGFTLMNDYAWFPIVLMLLYVAFYFIFKYVKNKKAAFFLMLLAIIFQGAWFCIGGHFAWWAGPKNWWFSPWGTGNAKWWMQERTLWFFGEWWVNSSIAFFIGLLLGEHESGLVNWFKKLYWLKLVVVVALTVGARFFFNWVQLNKGYYAEWSGNGPGIAEKFMTYFAQMPYVIFWVIGIFMLTMKLSVGNPVTRFFGKYSLDTYMMNYIAISVFKFLIYKGEMPVYKPGNYNLAIYAVAVVAGTIVLALIENVIVKMIKKNLFII